MIKINEISQVEERKDKKRRYFSNQELLQRFLVYMRKREMGVSTYQNRQYTIKGYFRFLQRINKKSVYKLNGSTLSLYLEDMKRSGYTLRTQYAALKNLKAFYVWLKKEGIIDKQNEIFNGFCIYGYIRQLAKTYTPVKKTQQSDIGREMLDYIDKFIAYYINKGYSENGIVLYKRELRHFICYLENRGGVSSIRNITKRILFDYQLYLNQLKKKDGGQFALSTKQHKLVAIRRFFKFLVQFDYLDKDPSSIIELPRTDRGIPTAMMTERELNLFLNIPDLSTARGLRDRTIMEVLYSSGIRNNELCHLKIEDVNIEEGLLKVTHAKGGIGFQRIIPIGRVACSFVQRYLKEAKPKLDSGQDNEYLFLNNFGTRITKSVLTKYMLAYRLRSNIRSKISAHSFRVTCATDMLKNGADVRYIQEQLGHRSLRSTQIYTRVFPKDLKKVHSTTHPREKNYKNTGLI